LAGSRPARPANAINSCGAREALIQTVRLIVSAILLAALALAPSGCEKKAPAVRIGERLPALTLRAPEGGAAVHLPDALDARITVLLFWAEGCTYCERGMPDLEALYEKYRDKGLGVVAVQIGGGEKASRELAGRAGVTFPMLHDADSRAVALYGIVGVPTTFIINSGGIVAEKVLGGVPAETIEEMVGGALQ
jgi:peroxiredoxin